MSYRFSDCDLDPARRALQRAGRPVALQAKVFELLHFLILHRVRVVPRAVLLRELWPDAYVTAASLTRLVKEARRAVGDSGMNQRVIQTTHGFGYRFVADVTSLDGEDASESELAIEFAQRSLEAWLDPAARDLRARVRHFAETCRLAVRTARRSAAG